ncbi:MAG: hypothetical protein M1416_01960 [Candidatus Pacearchaeota archaeon]|nr:hypothetical protein [Candidatus Pacearchaeota archaeon]
MKKRGKNIFVFFVCTILLAGIFITAQTDIANKIRDKIASSVADNADKYIEKFVDKKKIDVESITNVTELDFENLPPEINVGNVKDADIAFYQIDFEQDGKSDTVFVVSYSVGELKLKKPFVPKNVTLPSANEIPALAPPQRIPRTLIFEYSGEMTASGFLDSVAGTTASIDSGYRMVTNGSILMMSTNLEIYEEAAGKSITITLYKNGMPTEISDSFVVDPNNLIITPGTRSYFVYTIESRGNVPFKDGDTISVFVTLPKGVVLKSITNAVEL